MVNVAALQLDAFLKQLHVIQTHTALLAPELEPLLVQLVGKLRGYVELAVSLLYLVEQNLLQRLIHFVVFQFVIYHIQV